MDISGVEQMEKGATVQTNIVINVILIQAAFASTQFSLAVALTLHMRQVSVFSTFCLRQTKNNQTPFHIQL